MHLKVPYMNRKASPLLSFAMIGFSLWVILPSAALAQVIPGPADAGRIRPEEKLIVPDRSQDRQVTVPAVSPAAPIPEGARKIHFTLNSVNIEGATAFTPEELADIYASYIGKKISLDTAYAMAGAITERYRDAGYFLSLAHVPNQSIKKGVIILRVIEGYIGKVELTEEVGDNHVVQGYIDRLTAQRPVKSDEVESFLLRLNDLPGYSFRAVLSPMGKNEEGPTKLILKPAEKDGRGSISFDNYSSRFLGPNELSASYSTSLLPFQQTTVSALTSLPADKLRYGTLGHTVVIAPELTLELNGGITKAYPGYTLKSVDIDSTATSASLSLNYQWIRQRQENLALKFMFDGRDVVSDILGTPLTRDHIRAVRAGATYDASDDWRGYNIANVTLSQGIDGLGASQKDDINLSRPGAAPDFAKLELSLSRLQGITDDWSLLVAASGQLAPGTLYSSEQFGYGGQAFGRAYDASEITGDQGIAGSLELRYSGLNELMGVGQALTLKPYGVYDIGAVWNEATGQPKRESGASAGIGLRFDTAWHQTGNIGLAWPLTRDIATPVYGGGANGPRILLQIGQEF
jgi:hemolysin activation/secretion protein